MFVKRIIMRVLLTLGMLCGHGIQILAYIDAPASPIRNFINLVSFTGFCFCFGYVVNLAYYRKTEKYLVRGLRTVFRCYIAYIISGYSFVVIMQGKSDLNVLY